MASIFSELAEFLVTGEFFGVLFDKDLYPFVWIPILLGVLPMFLAFLLDRRLGDPEGAPHPIITFGRWIAWGERRFNQGAHRRLKGALYNGLLVLLVFALGSLLSGMAVFLAFSIVPYLLYITLCFYMLAGRTLEREVKAVFTAADQGLEEGRRQVARIVGRDTAQLSDQEVRKAALETLAENLSDGVIAPMLSWAFLGLPGILSYKMINTQDSMVGYLTSRYRAYGYFSAKLDDLVNLLPARLTMLLMLLASGDLALLPKVWRHGRRHLSPNSGYPEAALAFALGLRFGGPHEYHGELIDKPYIGENDRAILPRDVDDAIAITHRASWMGLILCLLIRTVVLALLSFILFFLFCGALAEALAAFD